MASRKLEDESKDLYFKSEAAAPEGVEEWTREMQPLPPFVVSGGSNTERCYFTHIRTLTKFKFNIVPEYFGDESKYFEVFPQRIKKILAKNTEAKVFCVFDWETVRGNKKCLENHNAFLNTIKAEMQNGIVTLCPSMPCIEYWFYLHFFDDTRLYESYAKISNVLSPYIKPCFSTPKTSLKKLLKGKTYLEDSTWVANMISDGKMDDAIMRAKTNIEKAVNNGTLEDESYTFVYKAFE